MANKTVIYQLTVETSDDGITRVRQFLPTGITIEQVDVMISLLRRCKSNVVKMIGNQAQGE